MAIKLVSALSTPQHIQFQNASGTNTGKIEAVGNDLVITNAEGNVLFGDVGSNVYIGDGVNNVDIIFEQSGSIRSENGTGATITLGSGGTILNLYNPQIANGASLTSTLSIGSGGVIDFLPDTGAIINLDGQTILKRNTFNGGITLGHDDAVIIAGGDTYNTLESNISLGDETVFLGAEGGVTIYAFPNNDTAWSNRKEFIFSNDTNFYLDGRVYPSNQATNYVDSTRIANWNQAYSWGDHSDGGYLASSSYTASDVLTKIKTVDGSGSGLDADTVDGIQASAFLRSNAADTATGEILFDAGFKSDPIMLSGGQNFDNISRSGFYNLYNTNNGSTNSPGFDYGTMIVVGNNKQSSGFGFQLAHERLNSAGKFRVRGMNDTASAWSSWATVWTSLDFANNSSNWNTAYGWGNHASAGYLTTSSAASTYAPKASPALTGTPTAPTAGASTNTTQIATTAFVQTAVSNIVDSAPGTLDTLNELAAALGDDANFSTTVTNSIATKLPLAGGTMTGNLEIQKQYPILILDDTNATNTTNLIAYQSFQVNGTENGWLGYGSGGNSDLTLKNNNGKVVLNGSTGAYVGSNEIWDKGDFTSTNVSNWNTAYGWGNHAGLYLGATAKAADSNLLDGINSSSFVRSDADDTITGSLTISSSSPQLKFNDVDSTADDFWIHVNSNRFYILPDRDDNNAWDTPYAFILDNNDSTAQIYGQYAATRDWVTSQGFSTATGVANNADNYGSWNLKTNDIQRTTVGSGGDLNLVAGTNVSLSYSAGGTVTITSTDTNTTYTVGDGGLTQKNFTTTLKNKLDGIAAGATNVTNNNQLTNGAGYITGVTNISGYSGSLFRSDNRTISPSEETAGRMKFGFTSWGNNNTSPYADFLHLRSYTDSSGGSDNLVMFKKSGIGMRIWQQSFGSATAYSTYEDVYHTGNLTIGDGGLTQKNFTTTLKTKLDGIEAGANVTDTANVVAALTAGNNVSIAANGTISATNTDTVTSVGVSGSETAGTITLTAAGATTLTQSGQTIEIRSTDTNTTYTVGDGGLTEKNFTTALKSKLDGIAANANNYSLPANIPATSVAIGSTVTLSESTDRADLLYINSSTSSWGGLQIGNTSNEFIFSLMGDGDRGGIYDDQNGDWIIYWDENAGLLLHHNSNIKLATTSTGITITGEIVTTGGNSTNWNTAYGWGNHATQGYATQTYVNEAVSNLVDSAPAALDTLNELAAALGDDANFSTTMTTALGNRLRIDTNAQGLTSTQKSNGRTNLGLGTLATLSTVNAATITDNSVGAAELNVTGNGSNGQVLTSDGDGTFSWTAKTTNTDTITSVGISGSETAGTVTLTGAGATTITQSGGTIEIRSTDTNTTYSVGDNGLTEKNFTTTLKTKLDGIEAGADVTDAINVSAAGGMLKAGAEKSTAMKEFETTLSNQDDWQNSPISVRERDAVGAAQSDDKYSPNLCFHWGGRNSNSLWMNSGGELNYGGYSSLGVPYAAGTFKTGTLYAGAESITATKVGQWNTAYGWGNHAGLYLGATAKAADSEKVDGINGASLLRSDANDSFSGTLSWAGSAGSDAFDLNSADIEDVRGIRAREFTQLGSGDPRNNLGDPTVTEMALFEPQFTCKTDLSNSYDDLTDLTFWKQMTSSSAWEEVIVSDDQKRRFLRTNSSNVVIPNTAYKFRVEFHAKAYTFANAIYFYWSSNSHNSQVHIWKKRCSDGSWLQHTNSSTTVSSWPGHLWLPFSSIAWLEGNTTSTGHYSDVRVEFTPNWQTSNPTYSNTNINLSGGQIWGGYPSGRRTPHFYDQNGLLSTYADLKVRGKLYLDTLDVNSSSSTALIVGGSNEIEKRTLGSLAFNSTTLGTAASAATTDFATAAQGTKADTAHGWGNHASAGYSTATGVANNANNYSLPAGSSSVRGGFKIGYAENGKNYPVEVTLEKMYVNVPWTDTNTDTITSVGISGSETNGTITLTGAGATTITQSGGAIEIRSTNTTYTVGDGGLTQKNFTTTLKTKLDGIAAGANNYVHPTTAGNKHIPAGGSAGQFLKYSADGTAVWAADNNTTYTVGDGGLTQKNFTTTLKTKLDGIAAGATNVTNNNQLTNGAGYITASSNITGNAATATTAGKLYGNGSIGTQPGTSSLLYTGQISAGTTGLFATTNNANSIITVNKHPGNYDSQLGFSSNGNIYYRNFNNSTAFTTQAWNQVWHSGNFSNNSANWNTAYGWGNHASAGYSTASGVEDNADVTDTANVVAALTAGTNIQIAANGTISATDTNTQLTDAQVRSKISGTGLIGYNSSTGVISTTANNYVHPTTAGNKHIPTGGAAGQFLKYSSSGTAVWAAPSYTTSLAWTSITGKPTLDNYVDWKLVDGGGSASNVRTANYVRFDGSNISGTGTQADPYVVVTPDTNTTYTADGNYGMTLSGTAFRLEDDRRRNSSTTDIYTGNTHDYTFYDADIGIRWYTAGAEEMRLEDDGDLHVDGDVIAFSTTVSDARLKDDVQTIENATEKVNQLRGVSYTWNEGSRKGQREIGVIAQEVEEVVPEVVHEKKLPFVGDETYKTVDYEKLVALLIESNKELTARVEQLENKLL